MSRLVLLILLIASFSRALCDDEVTVSPKHDFEIVQTYGQDGWEETLHFFKNSGSDIVLETAISWPAQYSISPDDKWILRIQKSGSGDNISYLYRIGPGQSVWRLERQIGEHALALLSRRPGGLPGGLYHTGIEFGSWDLEAGLLHFTAHGSGDNDSGINVALIYNLSDNSIAPDPHPPTTQK